MPAPKPRRIKLPFSEQFLWDLFNAIEGIDDFLAKFGFGRIPRMGEMLFLSDFGMREIYALYEKKKRKRQFQKIVSYLKQKGYLQPKRVKTSQGFIMTQQGFSKILKIRRKLLAYPRHPEKKWIMVLFDIPETERELRDELRDKLWELGFQPLQKSVWISPYDVFGAIKKFVENRDLAENVKILLVGELYSD